MMSKRITRRLSAAVAALAGLAMLFCMLPLPSAQAAGSADEIGANAAADANVYQALKYMQQLNALRARTDRRALTAQQIAAAKNADNNTNIYNTSNIAAYTADGKAVGALSVNWDLMKWAQTRANELVEKGNIDGHANMLNGKPSWYVHVEGKDYNLTHSSKYQPGTYFDGPEALAYSWTSAGGLSGNAVDSWYDELNYEIEHPGASASELSMWRQGYGHYLTEVSPLADIAGVGVAVKNGVTITVLEIGNNYAKQGKTQSVEDAIKDYEPKTTYTVTFETNGGGTVAQQTVNAGDKASEPSTEPTKNGYTFGGWYSDPNFANKYDFNAPVNGNITLYAKWDAITITALDDGGTVTTPAGVNPAAKLPKQVTAHYSDGSTKQVNVTWNTIDPSKYAAPNAAGFTVNGTVDGTAIQANATVIVTAAEPTGATVVPAVVSTIATHAPDLSQVKATVTYTDGSAKDADVTWRAIDPSEYAQPNATGFDVNGTVTADGETYTVTVKVVVTSRGITGITAPADQTVDSGTEPTYPSTVTVTYNDGATGTAPVTWTKLTKDQYGKREGGTFTVNGTVEGAVKPVSFTVTVNPATVKNVTSSVDATQTVVGQTPDLSGVTATVVWSNGDVETKNIAWPKLTADQFATEGVTVPVTGTVNAGGKDYRLTVNVTVVAATVESVTGPDTATPSVTVDSGTKPDLSGVNATVKWSNDTTTKEPVQWDEPAKADYTNRKGGTFTVNGTVTIAGKTYEVKASYRVNPAVAQSAALAEKTVTVDSGTDPTGKLPKTATVTWSNGDKTEAPVTWNVIDKADYMAREGKTFTVNGTIDPATAALTVTVTVTVRPAVITKVADLAEVTTEAKVAPKLPQTVKVDWSNGETGVDLPITWETVAADQYAKRGEFTVNGTVADTTGKTTKVSVKVKVTAKAESAEPLRAVTVASGTDPAGALPKTVKVTYTDGATENAEITWDTSSYTKDDYSKREGNSFTVKGKAAGLEVSVVVNVEAATVKSVDTKAVTVGTKVGVQPALPKTTTVTWSNGDVEKAAISWPAIADDQLDKAGSFSIEGTVNVGDKDYTIKATVTVTENTVTSVDRDVKVTTTEGKAPQLPKTVKAHWSDGSTTDTAVTWADVPASKYAKVGTFSVKGIATVNGTDYEVTATVIVASGDKLVPPAGQNDKLTSTGSNVAIIAVVIVLLVIAACALFALTKRRK